MGCGLVPHSGHTCPAPHDLGGGPGMAVCIYPFDGLVRTSVCCSQRVEKDGINPGSGPGSDGILAAAVYPVA